MQKLAAMAAAQSCQRGLERGRAAAKAQLDLSWADAEAIWIDGSAAIRDSMSRHREKPPLEGSMRRPGGGYTVYPKTKMRPQTKNLRAQLSVGIEGHGRTLRRRKGASGGAKA